ncbi:MAG: hypothetical protein M0004_08300 [Actinomycetota bacterium]|nr:hypothetical protein [Actinomycetota bacterium]
MEPLEVVVDGGIDDAVALAVLRGAGAVLGQVIATEGSVGLEITARTTARFLASIGAGDVPVRLGAGRGLEGRAAGTPFTAPVRSGASARIWRTSRSPQRRRRALAVQSSSPRR